MSLQSGPIIAGGTEFYSYSQNPQHELGAKMVAGSRIFRYVKAGATTALVAGKMQQGPATNATETNLTPTTASAVGDMSVALTTGGAVAVNAYADGLLVIATGTGAGYGYQISHHAATTGAAALTVYLKDPIRVATAIADSKIDLVQNPYNGVVICATTPTANPIGVAVSVIPAGYYGWVQSGGLTPCLDDGNLSISAQVVCSNGTAGAVETAVGTTLGAQIMVGSPAIASSTTEYGTIWLTIDT